MAEGSTVAVPLRQAGLSIAATLLAGTFTLFNFLTYGTTAQVARFQGAGEEMEAGCVEIRWCPATEPSVDLLVGPMQDKHDRNACY